MENIFYVQEIGEKCTAVGCLTDFLHIKKNLLVASQVSNARANMDLKR